MWICESFRWLNLAYNFWCMSAKYKHPMEAINHTQKKLCFSFVTDLDIFTVCSVSFCCSVVFLPFSPSFLSFMVFQSRLIHYLFSSWYWYSLIVAISQLYGGDDDGESSSKIDRFQFIFFHFTRIYWNYVNHKTCHLQFRSNSRNFQSTLRILLNVYLVCFAIGFFRLAKRFKADNLFNKYIYIDNRNKLIYDKPKEIKYWTGIGIAMENLLSVERYRHRRL